MGPCSKKKRPTASSAALGRVLAADQGRWSFTSIQHWWEPPGGLCQCWAPQYSRDMDMLESVQQRAAKMGQVLEHLTYEQKLRHIQP